MGHWFVLGRRRRGVATAGRTSALTTIPRIFDVRLRRAVKVPGKAIRIYLDYVVDLYFPANRLTPWERIRCTPLLLLVEYLVYRVDAVTEGAKEVDLDVVRNRDYDRLHAYKARFEALLRRVGAHNEVVTQQLDAGEQYVRLENRVTSTGVVDHAEVLRLAELRPSDVRLLHGILFAILRRPCDDALLRLMWPIEVLADIANDLAHYERDVRGGQFNTYAAFVALHGQEAPERIRAEIDRYERAFRAELATFPAPRRRELEGLCVRQYRGLTAPLPSTLPQHGYPVRRRETS